MKMNARRGIPNRNKLALLATLAAVSAPLLVVGLRPAYLATVSIQPRSEAQLQVLSKESLTRVDGAGVAFFDFLASTDLPTGGMLQLLIRPVADPEFHPQRNSYPIDGGMVEGVAELGSRDYPLRQDEDYAFRVVDSDGKSVLAGHIFASVHPILDASQWLIVAIGILASVIQIVVAFWPRPTETPECGATSNADVAN